jgi:hypothetical protein
MSLIVCFVLSGCSEAKQPPMGSVNPDQLTQSTWASVQEDVEPDFWEQTISIHESLPEFALQLRGTDNQDVFTELSIVDFSTGEVIYEEQLDSDEYGIHRERFEIEIIDMDFDSYQDIEVFTGYGGNWEKDYIYIMWDPDLGSFIGDIYGLSGLGLPTFDAEQKLVCSMNRTSAADHWFYKHQYIKGELVTIEEVSDNCVWDYWLDDSVKEQIRALELLYEQDSTFTHYTKKQLDKNAMELVIVEDKYVLFSDKNKVAEYPPDSEIGLLLAGCERYRD